MGKVSVKHVWKEVREDKRSWLIELALLVALFFLVFTDQKILFFHLIYVLLIYGAFYWSLPAFVFHAGVWVTAVTTVMLVQVFNGSMPLEELYELPILTSVLVMVFSIARKRARAEKALYASESRYRRLVELAFESVIILVDEEIVFANAQAVKLFNAQRREELIGESIGRFLHPISFEGFRILVKRVMEGEGELPLIEEQFARLDNTYVDVEAVGLVITYQNKPALQFIIRDITERKKAVETLRVSDSKFRGLLDSAPDAIVVTDKNGIMTLVNTQTEEMFGYTRKELLGSPVEKLLPARLQKMHILNRTASRSESRFGQESTGIDISGVKRDGREFPISVRLSPLLTSKGLSITAIIRDMTERQQAQEEVVRAARLAALGQMATALAHELNNPLQIIQGYLDVVLDFAVEPEEQRTYLRIVRQQIERLHDAADNILNYARPKKKPQQAVALSDLITQVLTLTGKLLQQRQIRVELDFRDVPPVWIAPDPLTQVFLNLIINAIESTAENEGEKFLHIKLEADHDQVLISFTSNGPVIPPEDLPRIFEPFYTTKPEGRGIGLWVSHNLVEQYDGRLEAQNLPDEGGVVFTISFPSTVVHQV